MALEKISTEIKKVIAKLEEASPNREPLDYFLVMSILSDLLFSAEESEKLQILGGDKYEKLLALRGMEFSLAELIWLTQSCPQLVYSISDGPAIDPTSGRTQQHYFSLILGDYSLWSQTRDVPYTDTQIRQIQLQSGRDTTGDDLDGCMSEQQAEDIIPEWIDTAVGSLDIKKVNQALELIKSITSDWD